MASRSLQPEPPDPKIHQKRCRGVRFYTSGFSAKIAPKTSKNTQDGSPKGLHVAIMAPSWPVLALQMAIFAPSWAILAPSWPHVGTQDGHLGASCGSSWRSWPPSWLQDAHQAPPRGARPPRTSICNDFRIIFERILVIFSLIFFEAQKDFHNFLFPHINFEF